MEAPKVRTDELTRAMAEQYNQKTAERHYANEIQFSFYNHSRIVAAIESGRAVDLAKLPKQKRKSVLIIGSGPTLDEALPLVKDWEGDILCSTSQASTLIAWGREPEHITALDPDSNPEELEADTWEGRKSILHVHPGVSTRLVNWWKGPMALYRKLQPQTGFYANEQRVGYSPLGEYRDGRMWGEERTTYITAQVPMLASVIPAQIAIAKHLGYAQQVLVGCDFSYVGEQERFTPSTWDGRKWVRHEPSLLVDRPEGHPDPLVETEHDGLISSPTQIFYSHQAVIAWRITECNIVNASHGGLLRMFPHVPIEQVIKRGNHGVKAYNVRQIREASEEYLARQNIYFFYVGDGVMPHEYHDPLHEIPKALVQVKKILENNGEGAKLDIEANMKRIKRLFRKVLDAD